MTAAGLQVSFKTPDECRRHLRDFWGKGDGLERRWRIRFAWRPVDIWDLSIDRQFVEKTGRRIWLTKVVEVYTVFGNWVAYRTYQMALDD